MKKFHSSTDTIRTVKKMFTIINNIDIQLKKAYIQNEYISYKSIRKIQKIQ